MAEKKFNLNLVIRATDLATARIKGVNAEIAKFTAPIRSLNNGLRAMGTELGLPKVREALGGVGTALGKVGSSALKLGAIATAAGYGLYRITKGAVDAGDDLATMAQRTGLAVDTFASLRYAAEQSDVSQEDFNSSMDFFNKALGQAKANSGPLLSFLNKVGPGLAKQIKGAKSSEEALSFMTDALHRIKDPQRRAALAQAAFGRSGLQMGQFLGKGSAEIQKLMSRFLELSGSQQEFAENAGALDEAARDTEVAFLGLRNAAGGALFPALTDLSKGVTEFLIQNREGITKWAREAGAAITAWVKGGGIQRLGESLKSIASAIGWVVDKLGGFKGAAVATGLVMSSGLVASLAQLAGALFNLGGAAFPVVLRGAMLIKPAFLAVKAAILGTGMSLGALAATAGLFVVAATAVVAAGYAIYKGWEPLKELFSDVGQSFKAVQELVANPLGALDTGLDWWAGQLGLRGPRTGSAVPRAAAAPATAGAGAQASSAQVTVDFNNAPPGTRVTPARNNTAALDVSVAPAMALP